jgi:hypothetical protein
LGGWAWMKAGVLSSGTGFSFSGCLGDSELWDHHRPQLLLRCSCWYWM